MPPMNLTDSVALVTGANRGLGARLVTELLRRSRQGLRDLAHSAAPRSAMIPGSGR